jgi:hypothetical protein
VDVNQAEAFLAHAAMLVAYALDRVGRVAASIYYVTAAYVLRAAARDAAHGRLSISRALRRRRSHTRHDKLSEVKERLSGASGAVNQLTRRIIHEIAHAHLQ